MLPTIYQVQKIGAGTLSVMAKPVSGEWIEDEFSGLRQQGITKVVSLLEAFEQVEVGLGLERELCEKNAMQFECFPIPDRGLPNTELANALVKKLAYEITKGQHVVIHCRAGIGRTGIIAAGVLVKTGLSAPDALDSISKARGVEVPDTEEQKNWLYTCISE